VILDSSALVAIAQGEPEAADFSAAVQSAGAVAASAATWLEASIVLQAEGDRFLADWLTGTPTEIVPFDADQARLAARAYRQYGRGSGSKARLNFGDCFSYALAKQTGRPLLFKGDDFTHTDIEPAV
jgi:ribonuclease VapC